MARTKKEETLNDVVVEKEVKTENKQDNNSLQVELENTKKENNEMKQQMEMMKQQIEMMKQQSEQQMQMMIQLQQNMMMQQQSNIDNSSFNKNSKVKIISYTWGKLSLTDVNGTTIVKFKDSYIPETITYNQLQQILTTKNKDEFFNKGLVAFVDESEKYYDSEGIVKPFVLSKENILSLYKNDFNTCVKRLDEIIAGDERVKTSIFWQTIRMLAKGEIQDMQIAMTIPMILQQYFKCKNYQSCIGQVNLLKDINYIV